MAAFDYSPRTKPLFESGDLEQGLVVALEQLADSRRNPADQAALLHDLEEVAEFAIRLRQFDLAIDARQEMLARQLVLSENQPSPGVVVELSRLGFYNIVAHQPTRAEEYLQRAAEYALLLPADQRSELPVIFINRFHAARDQGNLPRAREHLLEAWRMQNRYSPRVDNDFALLRNYARLMFEMGEFAKAEKASRNAVQSFDTSKLPKHMYLELANLYLLRGQVCEHNCLAADALSAYQRAAELLKLMPRRYPLSEEHAAKRCVQAIARLEHSAEA